MTIQFKIFTLAVIAAFSVSCSSSRKAASTDSDLDGMQHVTLDTMMVHSDQSTTSAEDLPAYKPAAERTWDLLHTSLDLSFDWAKETVLGKATLSLTPIFYTQNSLRIWMPLILKSTR